MATYTITFRYSDTGLTLGQSSWLVFQKLTDGSTPTNPKPSSFVSIGYGMYRFEYTAAEDVVFVIDGGSSIPAADRYIRGVLSPMDTRLDSPISTVVAAVSNVNSSVQSVAIDVGDIYSQVTTNNTTVNSVNNTVQNITQNVTTAIQEIGQVNTTLIDQSVNTYTSTVINALTEKTEATQAAIATVSGSVSSAQAAITTVNNNVQTVSLNLSGAIEAQSENLSEKLAALQDKLDELETELAAQSSVVTTLLQFSTGRWKVHTEGADANRIVYYAEDGTTALVKFDLKDITGSPTYAAAFERVPVDE